MRIANVKVSGAIYILSVIAAVVFVFGGCASEPTRYSSGAISGRTFNFVRVEGEQKSNSNDNRAEAHALIQQAIEESLEKKGLTKTDANGDLVVLYQIIISDGISTRAINDYFGYDASANALQDKAHQAFAIDKRNPTQYDAGTLVVDITDQQGRLLWRNFVWRPMLKDLPIEQRQVRLQEAVNELFKGLRVAK